MAVLSISGQWVFPDKLHTELSNSFNKNCGEMPYSVRNRPTFARMFENPWLVLLRHPEESLHFCHGTLINNQYILTTAVCGSAVVTNENATTRHRPTEIVLGEHDLSTEPDCVTPWNCSLPVRKRSVNRVVIHPHFSNVTNENDIALLFMNDTVQFDSTLRPICLPVIPILEESDHYQQTIYNTIWSKDSIPRQMWMRYVPATECREVIKSQHTLQDDQICARIYDKYAVDLNGSAGSALQVDHDGHIFQFGILSVGTDAIHKMPQVYINISKHINWINNSI